MAPSSFFPALKATSRGQYPGFRRSYNLTLCKSPVQRFPNHSCLPPPTAGTLLPRRGWPSSFQYQYLSFSLRMFKESQKTHRGATPVLPLFRAQGCTPGDSLPLQLPYERCFPCLVTFLFLPGRPHFATPTRLKTVVVFSPPLFFSGRSNAHGQNFEEKAGPTRLFFPPVFG